MTITKTPFGKLPDGTEVHLYTLETASAKAEILDYGATLRSLSVPNRDGGKTDVLLGYDTLEEYRANPDYFGATVGRFANRIAGGKFELNGKTYTLAVNDRGNSLHGGLVGFDKRVWEAKETPDALEFSLISPDGEEGYPGTLYVTVAFSLKDSALTLRYRAKAEGDTILNLTNHAYFNLAGKGDVQEQTLALASDAFTVNDEACLPTGEIMAVADTAMDFRTPRAIGERADSEEPCVKPFGGYDVNFILNGASPAAVAACRETGITLTLTTDQPGLQLYTMNHKPPRKGKGGATYGHRGGFCLETQHYPDAIHHPDWPGVVLRSGEVFESETTYSFSVDR